MQLDSTNTSALNNAAVVRSQRREFEKAEELYRRVIALPRTFGGAFTNLMEEQIRNGHLSGLDSTRDAFYERFPGSADLWEADWFVAFGQGDLRTADSISRAVSTRARTARQAVRSAGTASTIAELRGQPREALRWATVSRAANLRATPSSAVRLAFALDTAYYLAGTLERPAEARAAISRGLARVPMSQIPAAERDWLSLSRLAAVVRDPALARQAREGFERDQAAEAPDLEGARAAFASSIARSEQRWNDAVPLLQEADRRFAMNDRTAMTLIAQAHDLAGRPDSAIVYFERYVGSRDAFGTIDAQWLAGTHKRLGELYDAKGDGEKAIAHFERFVEMWKDAEPELQPKVREVNAKLERLRAKRTG